jgi:hypothetical protein
LIHDLGFHYNIGSSIKMNSIPDQRPLRRPLQA